MKIGTIALAAAMAAGSLTAQQVAFNYDNNADFSKFKTYKMVPVKGGTEQLNDLNRRMVEEVLVARLQEKGLTKTDDDNADLYAAYQVGITENQEFTTIDMGGPMMMGPGWGMGMGGMMGPGMGGMMGGGIARTTSNTVLTGTLALDLYERPKKLLVWRGSVSRTVNPTQRPDRQRRDVDRAVERMLRNYPPPSQRNR
jgi:hypothetical protein